MKNNLLVLGSIHLLVAGFLFGVGLGQSNSMSTFNAALLVASVGFVIIIAGLVLSRSKEIDVNGVERAETSEYDFVPSEDE